MTAINDLVQDLPVAYKKGIVFGLEVAREFEQTYYVNNTGVSNLPTLSARLTAYDASGAEGVIDTTDFTRDDFYTLDAIERKHGKLPA